MRTPLCILTRLYRVRITMVTFLIPNNTSNAIVTTSKHTSTTPSLGLKLGANAKATSHAIPLTHGGTQEAASAPSSGSTSICTSRKTRRTMRRCKRGGRTVVWMSGWRVLKVKHGCPKYIHLLTSISRACGGVLNDSGLCKFQFTPSIFGSS
jgi:hypothetical protein